MSDAYQVDGVTITPMGGGVYELMHSSLAEPVKVRGKEAAEDQAKQLAAAAAPDEGHIEPQVDISLAAQLAEANARADRAEAQLPVDVPSTRPDGAKMVKILLEENPDIPPTGLFLGHNGTGYVITAGEPVPVPDFLLEVLDHAVMSAPIIDSQSQRVLGYRERLRYPYRRVD